MGLPGVFLGLLILKRSRKKPERPPSGPEEGSAAEKYSKRGLEGSWQILRRDFSENASPRGPREAPKRGPKRDSNQKMRNIKFIVFPKEHL